MTVSCFLIPLIIFIYLFFFIILEKMEHNYIQIYCALLVFLGQNKSYQI